MAQISRLGSALALLACAALADINPGEYPVFVIDFDQPALTRYNELYEYFKDDLLLMEDFWWNFYSSDIKAFFTDNIDTLRANQPDSYDANLALANILGLDVVQTFGVSAITEISTYCTSIVAKTLDDQIVHVRNLDFQDTDVMKRLVYEQVMVKDGLVVAKAPSITGFFGAFTGRKDGAFSISFNVRERADISIHEEAVLHMENIKMTSPGHYIIGGTKGNEGVVISRTEDKTEHLFSLTDDNWFVAMTNVDVWVTNDKRYENAVAFMNALGQANVAPDGKSIIEQVLWQDGVIQADSIFTSAISADAGYELAIYDSPSETLLNDGLFNGKLEFLQ